MEGQGMCRVDWTARFVGVELRGTAIRPRLVMDPWSWRAWVEMFCHFNEAMRFIGVCMIRV